MNNPNPGLTSLCENCAAPTGLGDHFPPTQDSAPPPQFAQKRCELGAPDALRPGLTAPPRLRGSIFVCDTPAPSRNCGSHTDSYVLGYDCVALRAAGEVFNRKLPTRRISRLISPAGPRTHLQNCGADDAPVGCECSAERSLGRGAPCPLTVSTWEWRAAHPFTCDSSHGVPHPLGCARDRLCSLSFGERVGPGFRFAAGPPCPQPMRTRVGHPLGSTSGEPLLVPSLRNWDLHKNAYPALKRWAGKTFALSRALYARA